MKNQETTEYVVLGYLMSGAMHGYEIKKFMTEQLESIWHIGTSQMYVLLQRLEAQGLVKSRVVARKNHLPKKIITITPEGDSRFRAWVLSPTRHVRDLRVEFLTKLFFLQRLNLPGGAGLVEAQRRLLVELQHKVEEDWGRQKDPFGRVVLGFKRSQFEGCLCWLVAEVEPFVRELG